MFYDKQNGILLGDSTLLIDDKKINFNLDGHFSKLSIKSLTTLKLEYEFENNFFWKDQFHFQFLNRTGLIVNNNYEVLKSDSIITIDYSILSKNIDISKLTKSYHILLMILDTKLPIYVSKKLEKQCQELEVNYHDLKKSSLVANF